MILLIYIVEKISTGEIIMKKCICYLLIFTILLIGTFSNFNINSYAENQNDNKSEVKDKIQDTKSSKEEYEPYSNYLLAMDFNSGITLFEKGKDIKINPSSFAKIVTAIVAIENTPNINSKLTIKEGIFDGFKLRNHIGIRYLEELSVKNLIEAMMCHDADDAAIALGSLCYNSYDSFVNAMNALVNRIGASNTHFTNPAGFNDDKQSTTLNDMYLIVKYALKNETFSKLSNVVRLEINPTNKCSIPRILFNTNQFLSTYYSDRHYNTNFKGVKTYTNGDETGVITRYKKADKDILFLSASSQKDEENDYSYNDVIYMLEHVNKNFTPVTIVKNDDFLSEVELNNAKDKKRLLLVSSNSVILNLPKNYKSSQIEKKIEVLDDIKAPIKKGDVYGKINVFYDNKKCGEANLIAYENIEKSTLTYIKYKITLFFTSIWIKLILIIVVLIFIIRTININKRKRKKSR